MTGGKAQGSGRRANSRQEPVNEGLIYAPLLLRRNVRVNSGAGEHRSLARVGAQSGPLQSPPCDLCLCPVRQGPAVIGI